MEIFSLRILTIVTILYFLRILLSFIVLTVLIFLIFGSRHHDEIYFLGWMFLLASIAFGSKFFNYLKKVIISKAKYPLPLNLLCNILGLGKSYYFGKDEFDLDEIIHDNKLPLTLYYINNPQHPILQFDRDKILFHHQEYDWKTFTWKYFLFRENPWNTKNAKRVIEFTGTNKNNIRIKNKIYFEKIKAKENEVILLFVIHDLLFGSKASYYY